MGQPDGGRPRRRLGGVALALRQQSAASGGGAAAAPAGGGPRFSLRQQGGVSAGERWVCATHRDGSEERIARLEHTTVEQPEQNLRYFNKNSRPVNLRDVVLRPGGRPLFAGFQLFWNFDGTLMTSELMDVTVDGQHSASLHLVVITADPGGVATSRRSIRVSFDPASCEYVWDIECALELHSPEVFDRNTSYDAIGQPDDVLQFEATDPWFSDIPAPTIGQEEAEGVALWQAGGERRYTRLLADDADGSVWQMPLNHLATGIPHPEGFQRDGMLVLAHDPRNCPAIQFLGQTAERCRLSVCDWGYDLHLGIRYRRSELYQPQLPAACFRLCLCPDERVLQMLAQAQP